MKAIKRISFIGLWLMTLTLAVATVIEKVSGTDVARSFIYDSWAFFALWTLIAVSALVYVLKSKMKASSLIFHLSLLLILIGAAVTWLFAEHGKIRLEQGKPTSVCQAADSSTFQLPFSLSLGDFKIDYYPGTTAPMDFVSVLKVHDGDKTEKGQVSLSSSASPRVLPEDVAEQMSDIVIMHNDRMSTLQTFARDFTKKLCGRNSYKGYSAMQVVTGWMFYYDDWKHEPMIKIKSGEVRELLKTDDKMVSLADFISPTEGYLLDGAMKRLMQGDASVTDAKAVQQADEKFQIATMVATGSAIKIFPVRYKGQLLWYSQVSQDLPQDIDENKWIFVNKGLNYLNELVVKHDWENCAKFIDKFKEYQRKEAGADMPSDSRLTAEKWFNSLDYTLVIGVISLLIGLLSFFYLARIAAKGEKPHTKLFVDIYALGVAFFLFLTVYLGLLWYVAGHIPMSNGPETMLLMSWLSLLMMLCLAHKFTMCLPFGFLISGLTLMVALMGETNPSITPLMPVLQSPLLSIHVAVIMMAYALLAFLMLNGVMALALRHNAQQVQRLYVVGQMLLVPAVFLLAVGIFVGAVWANVSWGSYWSWDPKETWALITLVVYAMALHTKSLPCFFRPVFFHAFCVCAFLSVIITYFGVNFLLGGMHSYA